nr:28S ribosomal protein S35, mitochondrial [Ciona intestinalis]|eukprot:XP_004226866.1 28S ribosomal protein S35, mitochondrial [Ciona intestinalis]
MTTVRKICVNLNMPRIRDIRVFSSVSSAGLVPKPYLPDSVMKKTKERIARHPSFLADTLEGEWSDIWPLPNQFNPYLVPLPLRMGHTQKFCVSPDKYTSVELLKVQNFLHLTPPAIKKHCAALKKFCTPFPKELETQQDCEREFPVETHTVDYVAAGKTPRNPAARVVTKTIRLSNLVLDHHARLKLTQLAGKERYNRSNDILTIKVDRCPVKKQNKDFADYLLTALYFESWKTEPWESKEHTSHSDGYYWWEDSASYQNVKNLSLSWDSPTVEKYRESVRELKLEPEPEKLGILTEERKEAVSNYKDSVIKLLNLPVLA